MKPCQFCHVSATNGFNIIWEDEIFVAFRDRRPASEHHIQLIPKRHIGACLEPRISLESHGQRQASVKSLQKQDAELVRTMKAIGQKLLDDLGLPPSMRVMGSHIPPFNSVDHLHLHIQGLPYNGLRQAKYRVSSGFGPFHKGFGWFIDAEQAARSLESGRKIGVFPC